MPEPVAAGEQANAAAALAELFFQPSNLSQDEALRANELRRKYRDWRASHSTVPHADILDLNHEATTAYDSLLFAHAHRSKR